MELIATLNSLDKKEEILSLVDGIVVYSSDFSSFNNLGFKKDEIINLILETSKKVIVDVSFMLENESIEPLTDFLKQLKPYNCEFLCSDLGVIEILKELDMNDRAIYDPNTLITNSYDLGFYLRFAASAKISEEITLKDQVKFVNTYPNKITKSLFGYHLMFHSKRYLISMYHKFLGKELSLDNMDSFLIEQTRNEKYHIMENSKGTALFRPYVIDNSKELLSFTNLKYGIVDSIFINQDIYLKILNVYRLILDGKITEEQGSILIKETGLEIQDGFKYEDTIYQKELIKCQ